MRARAFTLVELLAVIAIVGILAAILIPVTLSVREKARTSRCLSQMRQVGGAFLMYANDNHGNLPVQATSQALYDKDGSWSYALFPYAATYALFTCPENQTDQIDSRVPLNYLYNPYASARLSTPVGTAISMSRSRNPSRDVLMVESWYAALGKAVTASGDANPTYDHAYPHDNKTKRSTLYVDGHVALTNKGGIVNNGVVGQDNWVWVN